MDEYLQAVSTLTRVIGEGRSLDGNINEEATPLAKQIIYGALRDFYLLDCLTDKLIDKPLPVKHLDLKLLIMCGIYSIRSLNRPAHASVNAVVSSVKALNKVWAKGLVNAVLRNYIRKREGLDSRANDNIEAQTNHPEWLVDRIQRAWPDNWQEMIEANNQQPPMVLRINQQKISRSAYMAQLEDSGCAASAGTLVESSVILDKPLNVSLLPGFAEGLVSVQDEASQLATVILNPAPGQRVLDACAAPGGKACHLLEACPEIQLTANDVDERRLSTLGENLGRLGLVCDLNCSDLLKLQAELFDRILLDAPCSATGIIRRHPDIKLLRRNSDIDKLSTTQLGLLNAAWELLVPGGEILYSTCSVLPEENELLINRFLQERHDVEILPISSSGGIELSVGRQFLPRKIGHDGFYYAHLRKRPSGSLRDIQSSS